MIKIESMEIEYIRGIRSLSIQPNSKSYAIYGANGTGKSSIVDAVEFCLTGRISRFVGDGLQQVTLAKHAAHIEKQQDPKSCYVSLQLTTPVHEGSVKLQRNLKRPAQYTLDPDTPELRALIDGFQRRDDFTLARRDIVNYV